MSANVWYEEVNRGLIAEILSSVKYKNKNGEYIPLTYNDRIKAVTVRKPEEEFKSEIYPCVSIYNKGNRIDLIRNYNSPVVVNKDVNNKIITLEDSAIPFSIDIQLDFWSKYQTDMNDITMTWLMKHCRQFNLNVVDDGGNQRSCNCMIVGGMIKSDLMVGGERLFHSIINYKIWVELDSETQYNKFMVVTRDIDAISGQ